MYLDGFLCLTWGGYQSPIAWAAVLSRWALPRRVRAAVAGAWSAVGFGKTDLAIGNGAGCGTQPVGPNASVDIPVIALFPPFLALLIKPLDTKHCNQRKA